MRREIFLGVVLILALALTACAPAATPAAVATEAAATEAPTSTTGSTTGATGLMTSTNASIAEPFLVDDQGRALYVYANDTQNSGTSACTDEECTTEWPPVIVTAAPTAGEGADSAMIGTITRDDGTMQATYNGWPLYYFSGDANPGDITGQGMEGLWHLIAATGNPIQ